jgi:hypothetical protein
MKTTFIAAGLLLGMSGMTLAHERRGPHGGYQVDAGTMHVELLMQGTTVDVFVGDATGKPVDAAGYKGIAILFIGGKAVRVPLAPAESDRLTGTAPAEVKGEPRGAVQITTPSGSTIQGKFD